MAHDPQHPAFRQTLTRAVDAVIEGVEQAIHARVVEPLRHALTEFVVFVLEQVSRTSSTMSILAHQRIEALAARLFVLEERMQVLDMHALAQQMETGFAAIQTHLAQQDAERQALRQELTALSEELASLQRQRQMEAGS